MNFYFYLPLQFISTIYFAKERTFYYNLQYSALSNTFILYMLINIDFFSINNGNLYFCNDKIIRIIWLNEKGIDIKLQIGDVFSFFKARFVRVK